MTDFYCPSCYCEYEPEEIHTMSDCGHMICKDCLREYILQKLGEGMKVVYTKCFSSPCGNIIPQRIFQENLDKLGYNKYTRYLKDAFIEASNEFKWCPGLGCSKFAEIKTKQKIDVECDCGQYFCSGCSNRGH